MTAHEIKTDRLTLRPVQMSDAETVAALAGDCDVARMTSRIPHPYSLGQAQAWIEHATGGAEIVFAILHEGRLIGCTGYMPEGDGSAEVGYWIGKPYWNRGFATEAVRAVVAHAFGQSGIHTLDAGHFVDNPASARVLQKLGFAKLDEGLWPCEARGHQVPCVGYRLEAAGLRAAGARK